MFLMMRQPLESLIVRNTLDPAMNIWNHYQDRFPPPPHEYYDYQYRRPYHPSPPKVNQRYLSSHEANDDAFHLDNSLPYAPYDELYVGGENIRPSYHRADYGREWIDPYQRRLNQPYYSKHETTFDTRTCVEPPFEAYRPPLPYRLVEPQYVHGRYGYSMSSAPNNHPPLYNHANLNNYDFDSEYDRFNRENFPEPNQVKYELRDNPVQGLKRVRSHESDADKMPVKKERNDFAEDDVEVMDNFVKFSDISPDLDDLGENTLELKQKKRKERIMLKVMTEAPTKENPISLIHELHPDCLWELIGSETKGRMGSLFKMKLIINKQEFIGDGRTKKLAKSQAATLALFELYNITMNESTDKQVSSHPPKTSIIIQADEPLTLDQNLANKIGKLVLDKSEEVLQKLTETKKWTVISSIIIQNEIDNSLDLVCLTTGTKCVKGDSLSMIGCALNDCHAEVLARRCFVSYIMKQINLFIDNGCQDVPEFIIERRDDSFGFRIKKSIKLHLFISTAPCGDARVFSPKEENETDPHPNRQSRGLLRAKIEGGEGTIPVKRDTAILTWDGVLQGHQRLQFMSCSDKLAVWNCVGIQGALLSHIIEPIYFDSIVLGSLYNYEHFIRGIHGRLNLNFESDSLKGLPETYRLNKTKVAKSILKGNEMQRQLTKSPSYAVNWIKGDDIPEVISSDSGKVHTENTTSRLAKRSIFFSFCTLLGRNVPTLPSCTLGSNIPIIYRDGKTSAQDYQRAKLQVMQAFQEQNLGNWIQVPCEIDMFGL